VRLVKFPVRIWGERTSGVWGEMGMTSDGKTYNFMDNAKHSQEVLNRKLNGTG
jgi:hypothetical protein